MVVVAMGSGSSTLGGRLGGDFPAFYSAGALVAGGNTDNLYDPATQAAEQAKLLGGEDGFLAFAYAPHVALAYAPLSLVGYRLAYVLHTGLMAVALVLALGLMRPMVGVVDRWFALTVASAIGFYPIFMAVGGGQNTALSLLLLVVVWRSLRDGRDAGAGMAVALLMFRPQYAVPLLGLLFVGRHVKAVGWAVAGIAATWMTDAVLLGPTWLSEWLHSVGPFVSNDADVNGHNAVSMVGFAQATLGTDSAIAVVFGTVGSIAVAITLARVWRSPSVGLDRQMALTAAGLVLLSPHTMFYDAGLIVITLAVLIDVAPLQRWPLVAAVSAASLLQVSSATLGFSPFAPVVAVVFLIALRSIRQSKPVSAPLAMAVA